MNGLIREKGMDGAVVGPFGRRAGRVRAPGTVRLPAALRIARLPVPRRVAPAVLAGLLLSSLLLAGHLPQSATAASADPVPPIRIAMVNAQSGIAASYGLALREGVEAVFAAVNAAGGVRGRQLALEVFDDAYDAERSVEIVMDLVRDPDIAGMLGAVGTPTGLAMRPVLADFRMPLVGIVSGATALRDATAPTMFHLRPSYAEEMQALVARFVDEGATRFGIFYQNDSAGLDMLEGARVALQAEGMQPVVMRAFPAEGSAVRGSVLAMRSVEPEVVLLAGTPGPLAAFARLMRELGQRARFGLVSVSGVPSFLEFAGEAAEGSVIAEVLPDAESSASASVSRCRGLLDRHAGLSLSPLRLEGCLYVDMLLAALARIEGEISRASLLEALRSTPARVLGGLATDGGDGQAGEPAARVRLLRVSDGRRVALE